MSSAPSYTKTPTLREIERSFAKINDVLVNHSKWLIEWTTRVICKIPVEHKYFTEESYRECYFGRWYYGDHPDSLREMPEFDKIEEQHRTLHKEMQGIVEKANCHEPISRSEYDAFIATEAAFSLAMIKVRDTLYELLLSFDQLTGMLNRQAFFRLLEQEYARVKRFNEPCSIVLIDIDHFKKINDEYGHASGDKVLSVIAKLLIDNLRPYDVIGRYGGEEFLIFTPNISLDMSQSIMERLRKELAEKPICVADGSCIQVTASFGIAAMSADEALSETIEHADQALYQAKNSGRNRVVLWAEYRKK